MENGNYSDIVALCCQIEAAARAEAEEIVNKARAKAEAVLRQAQEKARRQEEASRIKIDKIKQEKEKKVLSYLKLEEKRIRLLRFEEMFNNVLASLQEEKARFRRQPAYRNILKQLAKEGAEALGRPEIKVIVAAEDKDFLGGNFEAELKSFLKNSCSFLREIEIVFSQDFRDLGVVVEDKEGGVLFNNAFSQRLSRAYSEIRKTIYERLYGE